jgi:nitrous oxidase accessory protein NosD
VRRLAAVVPLSLLVAVPLQAQRVVPLRAGMTITTSVRIAPGTYRLPAPASPDSALVVVRGDDIIVDFTGVRLEGIAPDADPDLAQGIAVRVDGGRRVTLRGGQLRGYQVAVLARATRELRLVDLDVSHGWKPRLFSLVAHESLVDWLSFHRNERREWMRFGAGIYLEDVRGGELRGVRAVQGMNGVLLVRTDSVTIRDSELAFNSGLGIGLYRSSDNVIVRNRVDFNVRGYSHGFYRRGQDSAGLLLYEQSHRNVVAWNSVTHGGDGLFLWAGQHTMDTGQGGANDNLFFANDFSWAPTNGMEATFSRNRFVANRVVGSDHGLWGGYSYASEVIGNCFARNRIAIAIEHGQDNVIRRNRFDGDSTGVSLWANPIEPSDWGYPKHRDTRSRDWRITDNAFAGVGTVWRVQQTSALDSARNTIASTRATDACRPEALLGEEYARLAPAIPGVAREIPTSPLARLDRSAIVVDEWGPFDWRSPKLWPTDTARSRVPLRVLGPPGRWRVVARRGVASLSATAGRVGDTLVVVPQPSTLGDWSVTLEYTGAATVSPRGISHAAGTPVRFAYERFEPATDWRVRVFTWADSARDPGRDSLAFAALLRGAPVLERREAHLDYMWYRPRIEGIPTERWALEATTMLELPPGTYTLRTIADDAVRVWVDGALVNDDWVPGESRVSHAALTGGRHEVRVQYYQLGGWTELRVEVLEGAPAASRGSPGPH